MIEKITGWMVSLLLLAVGFLAGLLVLLLYIALFATVAMLALLQRTKLRILTALRLMSRSAAAARVAICGWFRAAILADVE